jgi:Peptidase family M49
MMTRAQMLAKRQGAILGAASLIAIGGLAVPASAVAGSVESTGRIESGVELAIAPDVDERLAKFARVEISADLSSLAARERTVLAELIRASREIDTIFRRQVWAGNASLAKELERAQGPQVDAARRLYRLMQGPWDRIDLDRPFIGNLVKPPGAGFYPEDLSKEEFERWIAAHPTDRDAFLSDKTVIERSSRGLVAVPYSEAYRAELGRAAAYLRAASKATGNASLKKFLDACAAAFASNDYYASDSAWMDLDAPVEVTIGPYETYEDGLFGYKASFESYVTVALPEESKALARYKERLPWLERNLPIPDEQKNLKRGSESPIRVVDVVFTAGDGNRGVKTIAFNLPNDERVREAKGSKKVLLHNVIRAKYDRMLVPIAQRTLAADDAARVSFEEFFNQTLHHELSHGLGPGTIVKDGRKTEVRLELKELYSTLEEAKADVMGIYDILALIDQGDMPKSLRAAVDPTYVAGLFRSARFGVNEAHGQGTVAQFNYLLEKGALAIEPDGRYRTVPEKFPDGIRSLLHDMLTLQATGDYEGTKRFLDTYGKATPALVAAIGRLGDLPVDIDTQFSQAAELAN